MIILSVDELRVATTLLGAPVPSIVDEYATDELGANAAAARSLVARGLATPGADEPLAIELGAALVAALDPLRAPNSVLELDLSAGPASVRCAEVRDADGRLRVLSQRSPDIWAVAEQPVIAAALASGAPVASAGGDVVELGLAEQAKLDELLDGSRYDEVRTLLGEHGTFLADALTDPGCTLGRLTRACRVADHGIAIERLGWVSATCGTWAIEDADPHSELAVTTFTPVQPAQLMTEIDSMAKAAR